MTCHSRLLALFALTTPALAQQAEFHSLGELPGGDVRGAAYSVSADGSVAVGRSSSAASGTYPGLEAFRWTSSGGMQGLGDFPGGNFVSVARAVNADGTVVVGDGSRPGSAEAFLWTQAGGLFGIGSLPGGAGVSHAYGVSADGRVVVGDSFGPAGLEAYRWTASGGMVGLGGLPGPSPVSFARGVSADGAIVIGTAFGSTQTAFRWTAAGGMVALGGGPGGFINSYGYAVSADGSVIVGSGESPRGIEAFRWTAAGGMVGIGDLGDTIIQGRALACSADGSVVVGSGQPYNGTTRAFVWTESGGLFDLTLELHSLGVQGLQGWTLTAAHGVSADGTVIVGVGSRSPGVDEEAWLAVMPRRIGTRYCDPAFPNNYGTSGSIAAYGSSSVLDQDLIVAATGLGGPGAYFLVSRTQGSFSPPGTQGILCLAGNIGRYNRPSEIFDGFWGSLRIDLAAIPVNPAQAVLPGDTWNFQCWYRDPGNAPAPSNFTDAVSVMFQ